MPSADGREEHIRSLKRKVGQLAMDNELLYEKIERMEGAEAAVVEVAESASLGAWA